MADLPQDQRLRPICEPFDVKSPFREGTVKAVVKPDNERMRHLAKTRRPIQIFEAYYNLCGLLPEVNNIGYHEQADPFPDNWGGIRRAHLIYKGLKRPCKTHGQDSEFYIYVTKPRFRYEFQGGMVCVAKRVEAPANFLFVAIVSFAKDKELGEILNWEWVEECEDNPGYPIEFETRYDKEVWKNG